MPAEVKPPVFIVLLLVYALAMLWVGLNSGAVFARDLGQWGNSDLSQWYRDLRQPDNPTASCCGEADSYYCDEHARGEQVYCIIQDDRDNQLLRRTPVPNGTAIIIPPHKLNRDPNLEGRAIVFLSSGGLVYCYIGSGSS